MFQRIDAVAIHVSEWPTTLAWYRERLDLVPYHIEEDHQFAVLGLPGGGAVLHIVGDTEARASVPSRCIPMVAVEDFDAAVTRLRDSGVTITSAVKHTDDGYCLAQIADPEGNTVGIYKM